MNADSTSFSFKSPRSLAPNMLDLAAQMQEIDWVLWPDDDRVRQYRAYRHIYDAREDVASPRKLEEALFPNDKWGRPATIDVLERVEADAALAWSRRHQAARNAAVVVAGSIDAAQTFERISSRFGDWEAGGAVALPPLPSLPRRARPAVTMTAWKGSPQAQVSFGCRLPPPTAHDVGWQDVFAGALARQLDARLRERLAATYGFSWSHREYRPGVSVVRARGFVANASLEAALRELAQTWRELGEGRWPEKATAAPAGGGTTPELPALDAERWAYVTDRALALGTQDGYAWELLHEWNMGWPVDGGARTLLGLTRVNAASLAALARTCHDSAVIAIAGDLEVVSPAVAVAFR